MYIPQRNNNVHLNELQKYFRNLAANADSLNFDASFCFLCFTNRCGSNYLASLMAQTVGLDGIGEVFNFNTVIDVCETYHIHTFGEYLQLIGERYRRSNMIFAKIAISQIELLGRAQLLERIAPHARFVLMTRNDTLGQAISVALAFATGRFTAAMAGRVASADVPFSRSDIDTIIDGLAEEHRLWTAFFGHNGIVPISVTYEALVADPEQTVATIMREIGVVPTRPVANHRPLAEQKDATNARWRELYLNPME